MSWGATAFTPIVTYNTPPFGFEERTNPNDFGTCPEDPYSGTEHLKEDIRHLFKLQDETLPFSRFREPFSGGNSNGHSSSSPYAGIFTFYNVVLFVIVMSILYYVTRQRLNQQ